uniref:Uncharacterized protein n=1 Tax=Anguilla anguilla TaxID=7936 RepID=A0A0E9RYY2_ANGAN
MKEQLYRNVVMCGIEHTGMLNVCSC